MIYNINRSFCYPKKYKFCNLLFFYSRHHHSQHPKFRKYSLPEDQNQRHKRHGADRSDGPPHKPRRISTQPEDLPLRGADRDQLDSHRSDDPRALRRHKTSRPSVVHIGRKEGNEHLSTTFLKKMYDHSPHAVRWKIFFKVLHIFCYTYIKTTAIN